MFFCDIFFLSCLTNTFTSIGNECLSEHINEMAYSSAVSAATYALAVLVQVGFRWDKVIAFFRHNEFIITKIDFTFHVRFSEALMISAAVMGTLLCHSKVIISSSFSVNNIFHHLLSSFEVQ